MDTPALRIEIRPNCSLSVRGAQLFFLLACIAPLGIGVYLSWRGFWPVLPFAGAELALLGWALHASLQRRFHAQRITVTESDVSIETQQHGHSAQVVFSSTGGAIYGECTGPAAEDAPRLPVSPYGTAKLAAEEYLAAWNRLHGTAHVALRFANVYGARQAAGLEGGVIAIFLEQMAADGPTTETLSMTSG